MIYNLYLDTLLHHFTFQTVGIFECDLVTVTL